MIALGSMTCDLPCSANLLASTRYRISELIMFGRTMSGLYCPTILTEPIVCIRYNLTLCYLARAGGPEGALESSANAGSIGSGGADPLSSIINISVNPDLKLLPLQISKF